MLPQIGSTMGNIFVSLDPTAPGEPIFLCAHLDTVPATAAIEPVVADGLNLSRAEVHGVVSFYHYFRHHPPGRHVVQICQAESCKSMHSDKLTEHARRSLGIEMNQTTADGEFTLEPVYCLGNCACSPAMMVDGQIYGRLTAARFDAVLAEHRGAAEGSLP